MKISILINHYKEPEKVIKNLLESIDLQIDIDFSNDIEIIICNDGYDCILSEKFLNNFSYPIKYLSKEHSGVCSTRNLLLDNAAGDYIMYCDADDMFIRIDAIHTLLKYCKSNYDVIVTKFLEEANNCFIPRDKDRFFLHGKLFKMEFIKENGIRFNELFEYSGDPWFINLAMQLASKSIYIDSALYLWKGNTNSITRKDELHYYYNYDLHLKCDALLIKEYLKRNRVELAEYTAAFLIITAYYDMTCEKWYRVEETRRAEIERFLKDYYIQYKNLLENFDIRKKSIMSQKRYLSDALIGISDRNITFNDWINYILRR